MLRYKYGASMTFIPSERPTLEPGTSATATRTVMAEDLASRLVGEPGTAFPPVFATARMIGLMELAAAKAMRPLLREGELSVGAHVEVSHTAPTPAGAQVTAEARFTGMEGKLYLFEVIARDAGGEVGRGTHKRAIVKTERLTQTAFSRNAG